MTKQEQIEEMAVIGCVRNPQAHTAEECSKCDFKQGCCNAYKHAEALYDAGYRKVLLDTKDGRAVDVVQYAPWKLIDGHTEREVEKARKETAKEILNMLYDIGIDKETLECCRIYDVNGVSLAKQICEKFGVGIEK